MLFNYSKCECCCQQNDIKITLYHRFPASVCNKIAELIYYPKCAWMRENETEYMNMGRIKNLKKAERQLLF